VITGKGPGVETPKLSGPQAMCARRIADRLDQKESFAFKEATLTEVAQHFEQLTMENFVLDPVARKAGKLDPDTKVSGAVKNLPLREGLQMLLDPLRLTIVVRDEVVLVTPRAP
jgi:hypothetical protein